MENNNKLTERQQQYFAAPRPIDDSRFPTNGYYFIREISERKAEDGVLHSYASVNWKLNEDDSWHDFEPNRFTLRLDYLFDDRSIKSDVKPQSLTHKLIHVRSVVMDKKSQPFKVFSEWVITGFVDMFDAMPYFSLFNPFVLAVEDYQQQLDTINQFAIENDEQVEAGYDIDEAEHDENVVNKNVQPKTEK